MEKKSYLRLKSGTDVRGVAMQTPTQDVTLTIEAVYDITGAFFKWLSKKLNKTALKIAVGMDVRLTSEAICSAVAQVATSSGVTLINCGVASTPSMFMILKESSFGCDGSVMITASHLPYDRNGLKFFTAEGGLEGKDIEQIIRMAENGEKLPEAQGSVTEYAYMEDYIRKLVNVVRTGTGKTAPLFGKRIIVDASNGVGGFFAKRVLKQLGAITEGSINLDQNGNFPGHAPNPESPEAIAALSRAVLSARADLGVIFDTDVDRAAIVDADGIPLNRDRLIALTAATFLSEKPATIVTDSVTTDGLTEFIENMGGSHVSYKRGYKNVINEAKRRNAAGEYCPLAMETSGHAAFADNYYLDDGAYLVCKLLIAYSKQIMKRETLTDLISTLSTPLEEDEVRVPFNQFSENFLREGTRVLEELKFFAGLDNKVTLKHTYEGVRVSFPAGYGNGWLLIRQSVHDPVLPVNFASREAGGNRLMAKRLYYMLEKYPFLDIVSLKEFAQK